MLHDDQSREEIRRLEGDFFDWFETADAKELEGGTLDGFLEELERVDPLPRGFDPQKSLTDFHEKYAAFLNPQKKEERGKSRMPRRVFFAAAAVAAALACMITAQALGVDIFGFFGRWTNETFTFTNSADKAGYQEREFYPLEEGETAEFSSLEDALEEFQMDIAAPKWFPERYGEFEVSGVVMTGYKSVYACTLPEQSNFLSLSYTKKGEDAPKTVIEKDDNPPILYESGGVRHYILTDHEWRKATWIQGDIECIIRGIVTEEEMKQVIDSIYFDIERRQAIERIYSDDEDEGDSELVPRGEQLPYTSVEEALEEFQLDVSAPKWFPERYGEFEVTGVVMPGYESVYACTLPEQSNFLSLSYTKKGEDDPKTVIEKDDNTPILYESGGVRHYILTDHEWRKAAWIQGDIECIIRGSVTEEEMKRIIDSIYS